MPLGRSRRAVRTVDYWPGFVDALSTMLLVIIFLLSVFMLAQFYLSRQVTGKDTALSRLTRQIDELTSLLALERAGKQTAESSLASLTATLDAAQKDKARLQGLIDASNAQASGAGGAAGYAGTLLGTEGDPWLLIAGLATAGLGVARLLGSGQRQTSIAAAALLALSLGGLESAIGPEPGAAGTLLAGLGAGLVSLLPAEPVQRAA